MSACRDYCTTNSTGSMSLTEYSSSSPCWCIDVFMEQLRCTWLTDSSTQTADVVSRQRLRSANQRKMIVPRYRMDSYGRPCFAVAGPSTWNLLPDSLLDSALSFSIFRCHLKNHFCEILTRRTQRIRVSYENARWWRGLAVTRWSRSTKLLYATPG